MTGFQTNMQITHPSRKAPKPGDVFRILFTGGLYCFGRVIRTDAKWAPGADAPDVPLIYIYRYTSADSGLPPREELRPSRLLIAPTMTNRLGWSRGYFETFVNIPLDDDDVLPMHCFRSSATGRYFDELSNPVPGPYEPVGSYGLDSFRSIDDKISAALGIPLAPEDA